MLTVEELIKRQKEETKWLKSIGPKVAKSKPKPRYSQTQVKQLKLDLLKELHSRLMNRQANIPLDWHKGMDSALTQLSYLKEEIEKSTDGSFRDSVRETEKSGREKICTDLINGTSASKSKEENI